MKLLQIYTFYPPYIDHFYASRPELANAPFEIHRQELLKDRCLAIHLFAPYLTDLGYDAQLIIANSYRSQMKWHQQYGTAYVNPEAWIFDVTRQQINAIKPDILYMTDCIKFDSKFIRSLSWKPKLIVGWRAAEIPPETDWSEYDLILSNWTGCWKVAPYLGARAVEYFLPGFPSDLANALSGIECDIDLVFSGQWTYQHRYRNHLLQTVAETLPERNVSLGYFLHIPFPTKLPEAVMQQLQPAVWGIEMYRTLKRGRIALNAAIDMAQGEGPNMRVFEATGSGAFLLTQNYTSLPQFFEPGVEVATFSTETELIEKVLYYLEHPVEMSEMAKRGQQRCLKDHSIQLRVQQLDAILRRHFDRKVKQESVPERTIGDKFPAHYPEEDWLQTLKEVPRYVPITINFFGNDLNLVDSASFISMYQEIFKKEIYKFESESLSPRIIDGGSNIGLTLIYFKHLYPDSHIIAFEPDKQVFSALNKNLEQFGFSSVELVNKGIWNKETVSEFMVEGADIGRLVEGDRIGGNREKRLGEVATVRLRNYLHQPIDLLKLNIVGAETKVLEDCKNLLANVRNVFVEFYSFIDQPRALHTVVKILSDVGFRLNIRSINVTPQLFYERKTALEIDFQLNIFAFRDSSLNLGIFNFTAFPDWLRDEDLIGEELIELISKLNSYPKLGQVGLFLCVPESKVGDANELLTNVLMMLALQDNLGFEEKLNIQLIRQDHLDDWNYLLPSLTAKITLKGEDTLAISQIISINIPHIQLDQIV
ncbi:MAG: FkbM family methyltransferase [Symploca sp. SIO2B6]|nr:FkbM family methyltransferase [Symploca sp. SIO2B6]